jgi:FtsP/CotA-like multicopper oxidase with cupredoxin domain
MSDGWIAHPTRRQFLGLAAGAGLTLPVPVAASGPPEAIRLHLRRRSIDVHGRPASVLGIEGPGGFHGIERLVGEWFHAEVINDLDQPSLIHWHGLRPPSAMDGVPMISSPPIMPGGRATYLFRNFVAGTHWMHSHLGLQEQRLLAAPLIVKETAEPLFGESDHTVMLHDFSFREPEDILKSLLSGGHAHESGAAASGVRYDALLANDRTLDDPEIAIVEPGEHVRLRIINGCSASNLWIDTGDLPSRLVAVDGNSIKPLIGRQFPLAVAQRADLRLEVPASAGSWPVRFTAEGSRLTAGLILATKGASIRRIEEASRPAPLLDLALEGELAAVASWREAPVTRRADAVLEGGTNGYMWTINGRASMHDRLFSVREGDRVELRIINLTSMAHPMHLHGHYFKVSAIGGNRIDGALRDTILVPPGETVALLFDADNPGRWAFHCHHLYHMQSGMMGTMDYEDTE